MKTPLTREQCEKLRSETFYRRFDLDARELDEEARTVPASVSSETPVERWFGNEILSHDEAAIDLSRVVNGKLPMLFGHNTDELIGSGSDFQVKDKRLHAMLQFAKSTRAPEVWDQVREDMPLGISIGYRINKWVENDENDDVEVTRWTLYEVSVVTVPADATVGINRATQQEEKLMAKRNDQDGGGSNTPEPSEPVATAQAAAANIRLVSDRAKREGQQEERDRIAEIRNLFLAPGFQSDEYLELERLAIDGGLTVEQTREQILEMAGTGIAPIATVPPRQREVSYPRMTGPSERLQPPQMRDRQYERTPYVQHGEAEIDRLRDGAVKALLVRSGFTKDRNQIAADRDGNPFVGMSLVRLAEEVLRTQGISVSGMEPMQIANRAFAAPGTLTRNVIAHGVSDFTNILLDAANKELLAGWEENDETFSAWTRSMSLSDFKTQNLVNLSNFGDLDVVPEHAEYKYGTFSDLKETIALRTYGKLFSISRQAIVNDDLNVFTLVPRKMGRAAARMVGDEAYSVLIDNPTLNQDSTAVFHANHSNYVTSGAAPSVTTLNAGFTAMATQTDPSGATINIVPRFLIVPRALENTGRVLAVSQYDPAGTAGTLTPNTMQGRIEVIGDARLDAFNSAGWFLAASPSQVGTVVIGYLNGVSSPYLEQQQAFTQDGVSFKVRIDCRAAAEDYRGLYYNDGA